ncbi:MAG: hypothetical protein QOJ03_1871 [Frankiaceae bacterium]|nr:hypothetical protein [Frankiaceae bacterium]
MPGRAVVAVVASCALVVPVTGALAEPGRTGPHFADAHGIHVVGVRRIDDRDLNVKVSSAALGRAVDVRILLPEGYRSHPSRRYPVLYLFHGTSGRASDWIKSGDAEKTTAPYPLITVMPDAGFDGNGGGWFTDWVDTQTKLGPSRWETFHIGQLVPWVDANLRTVASRRGRAIAGLSQGGFGSTSYAARHPDMFAATAAFSGAPEIDRDPQVIVGSTAVIEATAVGLDGVEPEAMFGSRVTNEVNWQGHDPAMLIPNLRGMSIWLWTATGLPGPYDSEPNPAASGIEFLTHESTSRFHTHLDEAGIPSHYDDYTYGEHTFAYWARDLRQFVGPLMRVFAHPPKPTSMSYTSIDSRWSQWGWSASFARAATQEFGSVTHGTAKGFDVSGSGTATVTTPAFYPPGSALRVVIEAPGTRTVITEPVSGRLTVQISLGSALPSRAAVATVRVHRLSS